MSELQIQVRNVDESLDSRKVAHIVVREEGDFVGDFGVTYRHRHGEFWALGFRDVRSAGGEYVDKEPSTGLLNAAAEKVAEQTDSEVKHCFR